MATPLTDSINALTTYANEVTGASDTTLSDAVHTLASGYGGGGSGSVKTGTFVGDGTASVTLDIGFEPDAIVIDSDLQFDTEGWQGLKCVVIVRNVLTINFYHNSTTDTTKTHTYNDAISTGQDPWGANSGAYRSYGAYSSSGDMLVTNKTPNNANTFFVSGQTYTWKAYKA
jgi:hypothetical protein